MEENKKSNNKYEVLKLKNQICFPIYAVSNKIIRKYKPLLKDLDLTYTQYITMMVLWEKKQVNEKCLCESLYLKTNTIAPLLKKLQAKGFIEKCKDPNDERNLVITLTKAGDNLKNTAVCIPENIAKEFNITPEEAIELYKILYKILDSEKID